MYKTKNLTPNICFAPDNITIMTKHKKEICKVGPGELFKFLVIHHTVSHFPSISQQHGPRPTALIRRQK